MTFSLKKDGKTHTCYNMYELEDMLSETSQLQKDKYSAIPLL